MSSLIEVKALLGSTKFVTDDEHYAHITIDVNICDTCSHMNCMKGCPARCFNVIGGHMKFTYEDCVECGTCDIFCTPGSVKWNHPRGNFGVNYRYG